MRLYSISLCPLLCPSLCHIALLCEQAATGTRNQARDQTRVSKEPAGLDFEPAGLDFEPAGLELKPVGLELEPAGLEFGRKLACTDPNWSSNRPPGVGEWPRESPGVTRGQLGPGNWN